MRIVALLALVTPVRPLAATIRKKRHKPSPYDERRFGRGRRSALDVLTTSRATKDIRPAETEWRLKWTKAGVVPSVWEATQALHALREIRDGGRVISLVRALETSGVVGEPREISAMWSTAVCALAVAGDVQGATAQLKKHPDAADAVALACVDGSRLTDACVRRAIMNMQRNDVLDLHGLSPAQAAEVLEALIADDADESGRLPLRLDGIDGLVMITGQGLHSPQGKSTVRDSVYACVEKHPNFSVEPVSDNRGALVLRKK